MRVLLVDDEVDFVTTLSRRLRMRAIEAAVVYDGQQALEYVEDHETDVMVLDLKMPGLDGMEVLSRLYRAQSDIQVVILTGHGTEHQEMQARRLNAYGYLAKPTDIETLVDHIRGAYKYKMEKVMAAVAFAEEGEFETARKIAKDDAPSGTGSERFDTAGRMKW